MKKVAYIGILIFMASCMKNGSIQGLQANSLASPAASSKTVTNTEVTVVGSPLSFDIGPSYSFGTTITNENFDKEIKVTNTLQTTAAGSLKASTLASPFSYKGGTYPGTGGTCGTEIKAASSCIIVVSFKSTTVGSFSGSFSLSTTVVSKTYATSAALTATATILMQQKVVGMGTNARVAGDMFGFATAIYGDTLVVGAYKQDTDANGANSVTDAGAVWVYTRTGTTWSVQQKIAVEAPSTRAANDFFGSAVAVYGNTLVATAPRQDTDASGGNSVNEAGAAFIYVRSGTTWTFQQKIISVGTNGRNMNDLFGQSVALYEDTVAIGTNMHQFDETGAGGSILPSAGSLWVYTRTGTTWSFQQRIVASGTNGRNMFDNFAHAMSLYQDTLVVPALAHSYDGAGGNSVTSAGAVFVFTRASGVWTLQQKVVAEGTNARVASDFFGRSVSVYENTLVVGADGQDTDETGSNYATNAGAAFVYTRSGTTWTLQQKIVAPNANNHRMASDFMGYGVAVYKDKLVVSAHGQDYDENGLNIANSAGAVYVYSRSGTTWTFMKKLVGDGPNGWAAGNTLGGNWNAVSMYEDTMVFGSSGHAFDETGANPVTAGAVFIYR